jgi:DNA mismatch endonuclease (patch repair protein)
VRLSTQKGKFLGKFWPILFSKQSTMADTLSPKARSERMSRVRWKDTAPEMRVRRIVHALGFRYRLHDKGLPGCPDLVFKSRRKVIFVHGCFWHRHGDRSCKLARLPKSRLDFWLPKLELNRTRDLRARRKLRLQGWKSLVLWECRLNDQAFLEKKISAFLSP